MPKTQWPELRGKVIAGPTSDKRLGDVLADMGVLTHEQLDGLFAKQSETGLPLGQLAVQSGLLQQQELDTALARHFNYATLQGLTGVRYSPELVIASDPTSAVAESFRALRTQLMIRVFGQGARSLALLGPEAGVGCTFVAANLSVALAQSGLSTILVEANMRDPRLSAMFGLKHGGKGLSSNLAFNTSIEAAVYDSQIPGLTILPSGPTPPNPQELLNGRAFSDLVAELQREYDAIIFDTPPSESSADGLGIASVIGRALIVANRNTSFSNNVSHLSKVLRESQCTVVGALLNEKP